MGEVEQRLVGAELRPPRRGEPFTATDPISSTGLVFDSASHTSPVTANSSGTVSRLRQFDSLHQYVPRTAASVVCTELPSPGSYLPVAVHDVLPAVFCADVRGVPLSLVCSTPSGRRCPQASQLSPTIGTATSAQSTSAVQPSEAFSALLHTAKSARPFPSAPVMP
ncbi:hypothetical protein [Aeromicrobium sp. UC242_57]|uniref:hypothetical protein n=1 Tax=Aeromicrobium sp. UC242_57 TaxID=3374624 RepID=UPI0037A5FB41